MSQDNGDVYIMSREGDEEWVSPTPAQTAIVEAVTEATDLEEDDLADIDTEVDIDELGETLDDDEAYTFSLEGHEVTVTPTGEISVRE